MPTGGRSLMPRAMRLKLVSDLSLGVVGDFAGKLTGGLYPYVTSIVTQFYWTGRGDFLPINETREASFWGSSLPLSQDSTNWDGQ